MVNKTFTLQSLLAPAAAMEKGPHLLLGLGLVNKHHRRSRWSAILSILARVH